MQRFAPHNEDPMPRTLLHLVVFLAGLAAVCWIGASYLGSNLPAATITAVIGACYVAGALELHRYRQATATLARAVAEADAATTGLGDWLARLHPSLHNAVRLRIEGERVALPAPALTPYLVGLLVLLGMLGTLLGMMATLRGTGLALESATDLDAIRSSLGAPVRGLAFAFGTSIAGVASSAMLGLLAALCRRERLQVVQLLDVQIATTLRPHSQAWQREEAFRLLQQQAGQMPALVDRLDAMMAALEQQNRAAAEQLCARQDDFHARSETAYARLATSIEQSLKAGVADSARAVGSALQPAMEATMAGLAREAASMQATVTGAVQQQLDGLATGMETATAAAAAHWAGAVAEQQRTNAALVEGLRESLTRFTDNFEQRSTEWLASVSARIDAATEATAEAWSNTLARQESANEALASRNERALAHAATTLQERASDLAGVMQHSHAELQDALESRDRQRLERWTEAFGAMTAQAQAQARDTLSEISRLVDAASEAPRAAAEVVAELRQKLSDSMVRDTALLEERTHLLGTLETLLDAVNHASTEQRAAVDALVGTSADLLERVGTRFTDHIEAETGKLGSAAAQVTRGAADVAGLGEALSAAVRQFGDSAAALGGQLQQIEAALEKSWVRSDEQLAYYVAQAREIVDLSTLSQKQIIGELQRLAGSHVPGGAQAT